MEHEGTTREDLSIAQAVHNAGGIVVCQVKRLAPRGTIHPLMVRIPGFLIDHFVLDPEQRQTFGTDYDPTRTGEAHADLSSIEPNVLNIRRVIAWRAALELRPDEVINLGVGISLGIPNIAAEEGIEDLVTLTVEAGVIGGIPGALSEFGTAQNPRAILDQAYQFDFYQGGGLDAAFLSFAEVDRHGDVNVTRFGDRNDGAGFTTSESESVVRNPVRRRIIMWLMLAGNAGIVAVVASVVLAGAAPDDDVGAFFRVLGVIGAIGLIWWASRTRWVDERITRLATVAPRPRDRSTTSAPPAPWSRTSISRSCSIAVTRCDSRSDPAPICSARR